MGSFVYKCGYLDLICELKHLLEVLIHSIFYLYRIYPRASFQKHKRFGIIVRCQEREEVIQYVQRLVQVFYLLLKDKILHSCSIVLKEKVSGEEIATYNVEVEKFLYSSTVSHFEILKLRKEFSYVLMNLETCLATPKVQCEFNVYFHTKAKIKGAIVKGVYPRKCNMPVAQASSPPALKLEDTHKLPRGARHYIHSVMLLTGNAKEKLDTQVPVVQIYRSY